MYTRPIEPTLEWIERAVRQDAGGGRGQPRGVQGRVQLRRDRRAVRPAYEVKPATFAPGTYTNISGNTALAWGLDRRRPAGEPADLPRQLPDHAGVRHPPRAVEAQELRRAHPAGRGRDRRHRRRPRRGVRRPPRRHHHERARHRPQGGDDRPGRQPRAAAAASSTSSAAGRRPACRPRPSRPTCCIAMYGRHGECAAADRGGRAPRRTASTPPSRRRASRSSTARR